MEIDITSLFTENHSFTPFDMSNNRATLGENAGEITWNNAVECAAECTLLDTDEKRQEFRDYVRGFGAWSDEEIAEWDDSELNALFLQFVSGDVREAFGDADLEDWDWAQYEEDSQNGRVSSRIFKSDDGKLFFYIGD